MIIKIKLGDLTARQMKAICTGYNHCPCCPLRADDDFTCYFNNDTIPSEYDLDKEIEVSTDFVYPHETVQFEERMSVIEGIGRQVDALSSTFSHYLRMNGYELGELSLDARRYRIYKSDMPKEKSDTIVFPTTEDSFNPPPSQSRCVDCAKFGECKEQGHTDENETFPETGGCEAFVSKKTVELAKRAPYELWKNWEKRMRRFLGIDEEAEKEKDEQ